MREFMVFNRLSFVFGLLLLIASVRAVWSVLRELVGNVGEGVLRRKWRVMCLGAGALAAVCSVFVRHRWSDSLVVHGFPFVVSIDILVLGRGWYHRMESPALLAQMGNASIAMGIPCMVSSVIASWWRKRPRPTVG
jgi:hypothetical protein